MTPKRLSFDLRGASIQARASAAEIASWIEGLAKQLLAQGVQLDVRTSRHTSGPFTERGWTRTRDRLLGGQMDWVYLRTVRRHWSDGGLDFGCRGLIDGLVHPGVAEVDLSADFGPGVPFAEAEYIAHCLEAAERTGLAQGLLVPHEPPRLLADQTRIEAAAQLQGVYFGPRALERYVRGAGWGLWITKGHIAGLGGRDRIARDAPVERVVARPAGVWLELTASPWDVPDKALARMEEFLAPILPTTEQLRAADEPLPNELPASALDSVTPADDYAEYRGPPVPLNWQPSEGDLLVNVRLARQLSTEAREALARAVAAWYLAGFNGAFGPPGFHGIDGPDWDGPDVRWTVDVGHADRREAVQDLAHRLGGWSAAWDCPVSALGIGPEAL